MFRQANIEEYADSGMAFNAIARSKPTFSVVIPAFNEEHRIMKALLEWMRFLDAHFSEDYEILVVMDGCSDRTPSVVLNFAKEADSVIPLIYPRRLGKGGALRAAFEWARGDFIFFTDGDASLPVNEFLKFVEAIKANDLVIGCRYWVGSSFESSLPFSRLVLSRIFNALLQTLFNRLRGFRDTQCGAKAVRRSVFLAIKDELFISDFAFDVNLIYSALRRGFTVVNVYVNWKHSDDYSKVSGNCWKIGFTMFLSVLRLRIYYSRFRRLLYSRLLKGLLKLFSKVFT